MIGIKSGIIVLSNHAFALDGLPTPVAAYSLHKLSRAYNGALITVRRSSDNATQSFGQNQLEINPNEIESWIGAGNNGFVTQWFDQSGNGRNLSQPVLGAQPIIVNAGISEKLFVEGKLTLNFNTNRGLWSSVPDYDCQHVFAACRSINTSFADFHAILSNGRQTGSQRIVAFSQNNTGFHNNPPPISARRNGIDTTTTVTGSLAPITSAFLTSVVTASNTTRTFVEIGNWTANSRGSCLQSCAIAFPTVLTTENRNTLESRLMTYYGIS